MNLKLYLDAQQKCEDKGVWPCGGEIKEWAHGDGAKYQKIVEQYYGQFQKNCLGLTLNQLRVVEVNLHYSVVRNSISVYTAYKLSLKSKHVFFSELV